MTEPSRENNSIKATEVGFLMPEPPGRQAETPLGGPLHIPVAIGAGKDDNADAHQF